VTFAQLFIGTLCGAGENIRKINNKEKQQPVSVFELSNYLG